LGIEGNPRETQIFGEKQMATKTKESAASRLKRAKKVSGKKEAKGKKELRVVVLDSSHEAQVRKICTLGYLTDHIKSPLDQNKKAVQQIFFEMWTKEMFDGKSKPDNFRIMLPKLDGNGKPITGLDDVKCTFQLKFRTAGIAKKVPKEEDLPEDMTLQEVLMQTLESDAVGLSDEDAKSFVDQEIEVVDKFVLAESLDAMLDADEDSLMYGIGDKLITYLQARTAAKSGKVQLPAFTEEEEAAALVTEQVVSLKEGMLDRIFTYASTLEQLRKLLLYCGVTLQIADFDFGMSDEPAAMAKRLEDVIYQYVLGKDDDEE
jgi:hypothetical protein